MLGAASPAADTTAEAGPPALPDGPRRTARGDGNTAPTRSPRAAAALPARPARPAQVVGRLEASVAHRGLCTGAAGGRGTTRLCQHFGPLQGRRIVEKEGVAGPGRAAACHTSVWWCVGCPQASCIPAPSATPTLPSPRRWGRGRVCRCIPLADAQRCGHWAGQRHCTRLARPPRIAVG